MISYDDALRMVLENTGVMEAEEKPLLKCLGQVAAEDIRADVDLPASDTSMPDGYAVRSADIKGADRINPVALTIAGTIRAGLAPKIPVERGTAIRIMTGSVIPEGADCVVRFEDTDEPADKNGPNPRSPSDVRIYVSAEPGANIRRSGSNVEGGDLLVKRGTVVAAAQISGLASIGKTRLKVIRRPVVAVIATGDELVDPGQPLAPAKAYNCNSFAIAALVKHFGGVPKLLGVARDKEAALISKIRKGMSADVIVTSGGVSKGDYDLMRLVLGKLGRIVFSRIHMGPGAAVAFALADRSETSSSKKYPIPVFALAGPPAGCMINLETLVRPALLKMRGLAETEHRLVQATAVDSVPKKMPMPFVRWTNLENVNGQYQVTLNLAEKIGPLASMTTANSLTIIPEGKMIKAGDTVRVLPLD